MLCSRFQLEVAASYAPRLKRVRMFMSSCLTITNRKHHQTALPVALYFRLLHYCLLLCRISWQAGDPPRARYHRSQKDAPVVQLSRNRLCKNASPTPLPFDTTKDPTILNRKKMIGSAGGRYTLSSTVTTESRSASTMLKHKVKMMDGKTRS